MEPVWTPHQTSSWRKSVWHHFKVMQGVGGSNPCWCDAVCDLVATKRSTLAWHFSGTPSVQCWSTRSLLPCQGKITLSLKLKFITLPLQHVSSLQVNSGVWFQKKPLRPQVPKPRKQLLSKLFCVYNSQKKKLNAMLRNFFYCKLLNTQNVL